MAIQPFCGGIEHAKANKREAHQRDTGEPRARIVRRGELSPLRRGFSFHGFFQ
jgi:hypothetical protein